MFSVGFFFLYIVCFMLAYMVSRSHLRFVEGLYFERQRAKLIMKEVWRKVIRSYSPSTRTMNFFGASDACKGRVRRLPNHHHAASHRRADTGPRGRCKLRTWFSSLCRACSVQR